MATYPPPGWIVLGAHLNAIWTPAGFLARGDRYILSCDRGHTADAPLKRLVDKGEGDKIMAAFTGRWRCAVCGSRRITIELALRNR